MEIGIAPASPPLAKFSLDEAQRHADEWRCNCGPGALAAICGLTLEETKVHMMACGFCDKGYTNPTMMFDVLRHVGVKWQGGTCNSMSSENQGMLAFPNFGLARIQWEGPWTKPGVPIRARYRHTHWVGSMRCGDEGFDDEVSIFDINAMCVGGWIPFSEWAMHLVPWLLKKCVPRASGRWHITHVIEVQRPTAGGTR